MNRSLAILFALSMPLAHAAMEFPPRLTNDAEYRDYARKVLELVPQIYNGNNYTLVSDSGPPFEYQLMPFLHREQELLEKLRSDEEYMRLAELRGPLQTFQIEAVDLKWSPGMGLDPAWDQFLLEQGYVANRGGLKELEARDRALNMLEEWRRRNISGFFSGWASLLPPETKGVLREPDIRRRWQSIRSALQNHELSELREKFRARAYGIEDQWTWETLDAFVATVDSLEKQLIVRLQEIYPRAGGWILDSELSEWLGVTESKTLQQLQGLQSRAKTQFTSENGQKVEVSVTRKLILREIPPYLAIFRGCVGGDCSTSRSFAWAYAPNDRHWWVDDAITGEHLGYISGALTTVDGEPCLYIRDVAGRYLSDDDLRLIIKSFYLIQSHYGAKLMTIMNKEFTAQNHIATHKVVLNDFPYFRMVTQIFPDQGVRDRLIKDVKAPEGAFDYDHTFRHDQVRQIAPPRKELETVRVKSYEEPAPPKGFWALLEEAYRTGRKDRLQTAYPRLTDIERLIEILRNSKRLPVRDFRASVAAEIERQHAPVSRNELRKHRSLLEDGHLLAPDAFSSEDHLRTSVRAIIDRIWTRPEPAGEAQLMQSHAREIEGHELMVRAMISLFDRKQPADVEKLRRLWQGGIRFDHLHLSDKDLFWILEVGPADATYWASNSLFGRSGTPQRAADVDIRILKAIANLLQIHQDAALNQRAIWAANFLARLKGIYKIPEVKGRMIAYMNMRDESNTCIPLALAYLRDGDQEQPAQVEYYLRRAFSRGEMPQEYAELAKRVLDESSKPRRSRCEDSLSRSIDFNF